MENERLAVIRDVRLSLRAWLDSLRSMPDLSAQPRGTMTKLSTQIHMVDAALAGAPESLTATKEWKAEIAAYADALRELRARLGNFEMTLRIRQGQIRKTSDHLGLARRWSDLAKQIG